MYSEQSFLPPPLPGSPPRFTLPPLGSPRFSTTLPRLPYTGPNSTTTVTTNTPTTTTGSSTTAGSTTTAQQQQQQRESGVDNGNNNNNVMNKVDRWRLPPLFSSTPSSSSTPSNYQAPFSPYSNISSNSSTTVNGSSNNNNNGLVNKVSTSTSTTTTSGYSSYSPYSYNDSNHNNGNIQHNTYQSTQQVSLVPPPPTQVGQVLPSSVVVTSTATATAAVTAVPVQHQQQQQTQTSVVPPPTPPTLPQSSTSSLGYRYDNDRIDRHHHHPTHPPSTIWRSASSLQQQNNESVNNSNNNNKSNSVFIKHEAIPRSSLQQKQSLSRPQKSPRFMSTPVPDDPYYYYGDESNRSGEWMDDTNDYTITTSTSNNNNNNTRSNRAIEFTERTLEINHEFLENKETIYFEKIKKLQDELSAIQHGGHEEFEEYIIDMEKERSKEIKNAQLYMEYRIQCAEKLYNDALHAVEEEAEVEKRDLKKAMLFIIEEKRKRIKEYRDEEISLTNDFVITVPQTRSNRRRTRGITTAISVEGIIDGTLTLEQILAVNKNNGVKTIKRRNNDRSRDSTALNHSLSARNETELEADYKAMRKDTKQEHMNVTSTTTTTTTMGTLSDNDDDDDDDDEYREDEKDISSSSKRARSHNYPNSNGTHPRSSRR